MKFNPYIKRIGFVTCFVLLSILIYNIFANKSGVEEDIVYVNATPITNKIIIIDAGHRFARAWGNFTALKNKIAINLL